MEEDRLLALLGPVHHILPFARVEAVLTDVVLDLIGRVLALDVFELLEDDEVLLLVDLHDLDEDDVGRFLDDLSQRIRGLHVGVREGRGQKQDRQGEEKELLHRDSPEMAPVGTEPAGNIIKS